MPRIDAGLDTAPARVRVPVDAVDEDIGLRIRRTGTYIGTAPTHFCRDAGSRRVERVADNLLRDQGMRLACVIVRDGMQTGNPG
jgi:hypothetical protein